MIYDMYNDNGYGPGGFMRQALKERIDLWGTVGKESF